MKQDIPERFRYKNHDRTPDLLLLANLGYTITTTDRLDSRPNFPSGGAHGYDPTHPEMHAVFMAIVSVLFVVGAEFFVGLITQDANVTVTAVSALRIVSIGYIFYGVGMVMINAFNGAGDSRTPTWIHLFWFWIFQIPFALLLSKTLNFGTTGVFIAIVVTETCISITSVILFKRGKWKLVKV